MRDADGGDALDQRGFVRRLSAQSTISAASLDRGEHAVGHPVDEADQEVAGAHGRVANLQFEDPACRIEFRKFVQPLLERSAAFAEFLRLGAEALQRSATSGPTVRSIISFTSGSGV